MHSAHAHWIRRLAVLALVPALGLPIPALAAPAEIETSHRAKDLQVDGQRHYGEQSYEAAGDTWARIFDVLPEGSINRAERDTTLLITLDAYQEAYRRHEGDESEHALDVLRKAIALCDRYEADFRQAHGPTDRPSEPARTAMQQVRDLLEAAERKAGKHPRPSPASLLFETTPPTPGLTLNGHDMRGPSGNGLIATGSVLLALGLASTSLIVVGAVRAKDARKAHDQAELDMDEANMRAADRKGKQANGMIIGGSILTGGLLAAGGTLLGIGIRRRVRYQAIAPAFGPQWVGVSVSGRF